MDSSTNIFKGKSILIISTEAWGDHYVSKHHYAMALAKLGNRVFFLEPPNGANKISRLYQSDPHLHIVNFSGTTGLRFMPSRLAKFFQQKDAQKLATLCQARFDIVWSFDNSRFFDLSIFGAALKIGHIMDLAVDFNTQKHASSADFCFGVTREIVSRMGQYNCQSHFINHGFSPPSIKSKIERTRERKQAGYSGNLLLKFIDRKLVLNLIETHPDVDFNFYGGYTKSNLSDGNDREGLEFVGCLQKKSNVNLHGALDRDKLMHALEQQDILLLFYDAERYAGACHNSHKILEYLSTGNEILSLPVLEYAQSKLISTASNRKEYLKKFEELLGHQIDADLQRERVAYATDHTYIRQIARIQNIIDGE